MYRVTCMRRSVCRGGQGSSGPVALTCSATESRIVTAVKSAELMSLLQITCDNLHGVILVTQACAPLRRPRASESRL